MVNSDEHLNMKNGKKICWNYRKGRCRFGSNCSFAHDSDLNEKPVEETDKDALKDEANQNKILQRGIQLTQKVSDSSATISSNGKKRNRPGLSESIVPSKRVLKAYSYQKQSSFKSNSNQRKLT